MREVVVDGVLMFKQKKMKENKKTIEWSFPKKIFSSRKFLRPQSRVGDYVSGNISFLWEEILYFCPLENVLGQLGSLRL